MIIVEEGLKILEKREHSGKFEEEKSSNNRTTLKTQRIGKGYFRNQIWK